MVVLATGRHYGKWAVTAALPGQLALTACVRGNIPPMRGRRHAGVITAPSLIARAGMLTTLRLARTPLLTRGYQRNSTTQHILGKSSVGQQWGRHTRRSQFRRRRRSVERCRSLSNAGNRGGRRDSLVGTAQRRRYTRRA